MSSTWNDPDREPPPDPELDALARLYRDHPPPEPPEPAWRQALSRAELRLSRRPNRPARWPLVLGLVGAAAALGGVVLARALWPAPGREGPAVAAVSAVEEEPFPVAALSEIEIIRMDPNDADRVVLGEPLMGTMEFVSPDDVELVRVDPDPEAGRRPFLRRDRGGPMIIVADAKVNPNINADVEFDDQP
jgi:hypothetical protein